MVIFTTFFVGNIGQVNVFYDILERKNAFLEYKNKNFKISKKCHFSKVVNPRFWFKNGRFFQFFFGQYRPGQSPLRYSRTKNAFLGYKNKIFKKSKNWHFFKGVNPWFWFKNGHFSNFFLGNIGQENVFYDIVERRNAFLGDNLSFFQGVNPWFWFKNEKEQMLDQKIEVCKTSEKSNSLIGLIHGFCQKIELVTMRIVWANQGKKDRFFNILDRKEYFLEQKREFSKMCKKSKFFNGVSPWTLSKKRSFYHVSFFW